MLQEPRINRSKSGDNASLQQNRVFTNVATYKGLMVSLKHIKTPNLQLTREIRIGFTEARMVYTVIIIIIIIIEVEMVFD